MLRAPYYALCFALDNLFEGRPIARFWFLETVARMPYFSYISMLHLYAAARQRIPRRASRGSPPRYESLGWWRRSAEAKKVHFAEEWNEFHHLLAMEALGGDALWQDRFFAHHAAIVCVSAWMSFLDARRGSAALLGARQGSALFPVGTSPRRASSECA